MSKIQRQYQYQIVIETVHIDWDVTLHLVLLRISSAIYAQVL